MVKLVKFVVFSAWILDCLGVEALAKNRSLGYNT